MSNDGRKFEKIILELKDRISECYELADIEPKQKISGVSRTFWEVDAKGVLADGSGFVIIECRQRKKRTTQSDIAALAYTIKDCRAKGGVIVTGRPLQKGASIVAGHEKIHHTILNLDSTPTEYLMTCLSSNYRGRRISHGIEERISVSDRIIARRPIFRK